MMTRDDLRYHKAWILLLGFILLLLAAMPFLMGGLERHLDSEIARITEQRNRRAFQLEQWQKDHKTALEISQSMPQSEVRKLLAPSDRENFINQIEVEAAAARLTNLRYMLSPARPWDGAAQFPGIEDIVQSRLELEADAPHDGDVFAFLEKIATLEGKVILESFTLSRLHPKSESSMISAHNLHLKASFLWLGNKERS